MGGEHSKSQGKTQADKKSIAEPKKIKESENKNPISTSRKRSENIIRVSDINSDMNDFIEYFEDITNMTQLLQLCLSHEDEFSASTQDVPFNRQTFGNKAGSSNKNISSFDNEKKRLNKCELDFYNYPLKIDKIIKNETLDKKRNLSPPPLLVVDLGNNDKKSSVKSPRFPFDVLRNDEDKKVFEKIEENYENEKSPKNEKINPKKKKLISNEEEKEIISIITTIPKEMKKFELLDKIDKNQLQAKKKISKRDSKGDSQLDMNLSDMSEMDSKYMSANEIKELRLKPPKPEKTKVSNSNSKINRSVSPFRNTKPPMGDLKKKDSIKQEKQIKPREVNMKITNNNNNSSRENSEEKPIQIKISLDLKKFHKSPSEKKLKASEKQTENNLNDDFLKSVVQDIDKLTQKMIKSNPNLNSSFQNRSNYNFFSSNQQSESSETESIKKKKYDSLKNLQSQK